MCGNDAGRRIKRQSAALAGARGGTGQRGVLGKHLLHGRPFINPAFGVHHHGARCLERAHGRACFDAVYIQIVTRLERDAVAIGGVAHITNTHITA